MIQTSSWAENHWTGHSPRLFQISNSGSIIPEKEVPALAMVKLLVSFLEHRIFHTSTIITNTYLWRVYTLQTTFSTSSFFFFPHINSMRKSGWLLLTFYRWGNWGFKDQIHRYQVSSTRSIGNNHAHILISNGSRQEQVPGIPATRVWIPLLSFISLISWGKLLNLCKYHI